MQTTETKLPVPDVTTLDAVFGVKPPLPAWGDIPDRFKNWRDPYCEVVSALFFRGGKLSDFGLTLKPGLDAKAVYRAIKCCLGSFEPKHEHKEAGVAYMLSQWFDGEPKAKAEGGA